jgi:hypothetical protein
MNSIHMNFTKFKKAIDGLKSVFRSGRPSTGMPDQSSTLMEESLRNLQVSLSRRFR